MYVVLVEHFGHDHSRYQTNASASADGLETQQLYQWLPDLKPNEQHLERRNPNGGSWANIYLPVTRTHTQGDAKHSAKHAAVALQV